ncbi:MAG: biotin--[acetyl-CoA-carboxylase] ligase [Xanthobacteraceae bacterium]|jgi:BirA family biotin operon repressor/biotin-[acetyl-CoA-carboxylase] ligase
MQLDPTAIEAEVRLKTLAAIGSTNAQARLWAQRGERGPLWITATAQSEGRGRHGRAWISPPGNLYASLLLSDPSPFEHAPQLAFVAALALRDAIVAEAAALTPQLAFKWPNDLLLAGDKCAGILIEGDAALDGEEAQAPKRLTVIVGIGVNCTSHPPRSSGTGSFPATDLQAHGAEIMPAQLFRRLSATMCRRLAQWDRSHGFAAILADWLACARGIGEQITVRNNGAEVQGRFVGLDQAGRLLLELRNGTLTKISAGDVFPLAVHGPRRIADRPG